MPLIKCPDCATEISDQAPACPKCARPMTAAARPADSRPEGASDAVRLGLESGLRVGGGGFVLAFFICCVFYGSQHASSAFWALNAAWESIGSILGYSVLVGVVFAVVGGPIVVVTRWRRQDDD
jgi:hypothetical protein